MKNIFKTNRQRILEAQAIGEELYADLLRNVIVPPGYQANTSGKISWLLTLTALSPEPTAQRQPVLPGTVIEVG